MRESEVDEVGGELFKQPTENKRKLLDVTPAMTLKVLQASQNFYVRGGSDVMFFQNIDLLERRGCRVIPFAARDHRNRTGPWNRFFPAAADFERPGPLDFVRYVYSRPARRAMERIIAEHRPRMAHLHIYYGKLTASILGPLGKAGIPVVQTLHEYKLICPVYRLVSSGKICEACRGKQFRRALPKRCNRGSLARTALSVAESYVSRRLGAVDKIHTFIAVSDALREKYVEHGFPAGKIVTIRNWVDASRIEPAAGPGSYLVYFGRIERLKGIFTLLEAVSGLPHVRLLLVGDGEARPEVVDRIRREGLRHVEWLGFQTGRKLHDLIAGAIGAVVPSEWHEPFPTSILEAFARARPVIGAAIGGIPEMITDGVDGYLFPPGETPALREKILLLHTHPRQAVKMGRAGRRKVETVFNEERYFNELMTVYEKAIAGS